jgi:hypothetical protein
MASRNRNSVQGHGGPEKADLRAVIDDARQRISSYSQADLSWLCEANLTIEERAQDVVEGRLDPMSA